MTTQVLERNDGITVIEIGIPGPQGPPGTLIDVAEDGVVAVTPLRELDFRTGFDVSSPTPRVSQIDLDLSEVSAGGELAGTLDAPTVDELHSGSTHQSIADGLNAHEIDVVGAHNASAIAFTPVDTIVSADTQSAVLEALTDARAYTDDGHVILSSRRSAVDGVAALDGTGTVPDAQIPDTIARDSEFQSADASHAAAADPHTGYQKESEKGATSGYASLDSAGKVPTAQIPAVAFGSVFVVASQAAMLALAANPGDIAVRSDVSQTFILTALPASTLGNWVELLSGAGGVTSVNGATGAVTGVELTANKGAASGYAALDGSGFVPDAQIASTIARDSEFTAADAAHVAAGDPHTGYQKESEKSAISGYAALDGSGYVPDAQINPAIARDTEVSDAVSAHTSDTSDAHDASAVSFSPTSQLTATDVQAAIAQARAADAFVNLAAPPYNLLADDNGTNAATNAAAIQAAHDALPASGGVLVSPAGVARISPDALTFTKPILVLGVGWEQSTVTAGSVWRFQSAGTHGVNCTGAGVRLFNMSLNGGGNVTNVLTIAGQNCQVLYSHVRQPATNGRLVNIATNGASAWLEGLRLNGANQAGSVGVYVNDTDLQARDCKPVNVATAWQLANGASGAEIEQHSTPGSTIGKNILWVSGHPSNITFRGRLDNVGLGSPIQLDPDADCQNYEIDVLAYITTLADGDFALIGVDTSAAAVRNLNIHVVSAFLNTGRVSYGLSAQKRDGTAATNGSRMSSYGTIFSNSHVHAVNNGWGNSGEPLIHRGNVYTADLSTFVRMADDVGSGSTGIDAHVAGADPHAGYVLESLLDAKGDLVVASAADTPARLATGSNYQELTADSATASGLKWKTRPFVDVTDYGADPTGATDSTAAIQAAIDATNRAVFFPPGTYLISGADGLRVSTAGTALYGAGMEKTYLRSSTGNIITIGSGVPTSQGEYCIQDMNIRSYSGGGHCFSGVSVSGSVFQRLDVRQDNNAKSFWNQNAVNMSYHNNLWSHCRFQHALAATAPGFNMTSSGSNINSNTWERLQFLYSGNYVFHFEEQSNNYLYNNALRDILFEICDGGLVESLSTQGLQLDNLATYDQNTTTKNMIQLDGGAGGTKTTRCAIRGYTRVGGTLGSGLYDINCVLVKTQQTFIEDAMRGSLNNTSINFNSGSGVFIGSSGATLSGTSGRLNIIYTNSGTIRPSALPTASRWTAGVAGSIMYDTTVGALIADNGTAWKAILDEDHTASANPHPGSLVSSFAKSGSTALTGAVTISGGTNVTLTESGQNVQIDANAGTSATFLSTTKWGAD